MALSPPTSREFVLVAFLLVGLVSFYYYMPDSQRTLVSVPRPWSAPLDYTRKTVQNEAKLGLIETSRDRSGWSIFDRLYIYKGVVFIVTDRPETIPELSAIYSKGIDIEVGEEAEMARLPDDGDIRIISTAGAKTLFGSGAGLLDGVSFLVNDPRNSFATIITGPQNSGSASGEHTRRWTALFLPRGNTTLPSPRRMWFNRLDAFRWRDYSEMNQWVVRSSFPELTMEFIDDWDDRANMGVAFVFERVVLADRSAAMPGLNYQRYQRTAATAFGLPGSAYWWSSIRNNVVKFAGLDPEEGSSTMTRPVITYVSRQSWGRRMLIQADHEQLVAELDKIGSIYGYEINVVEAENMSRLEQLQLAARTTILMGVHGNGLTSLLWMKPSRRSTVIEFFFEGGFAHDYEWTSRALGITHYAFTSPDIPIPSYPKGFQGNSIAVDGAMVAALCVRRLELEEDVDEG
ncbi:hypothetical protein MKEN_01125800 [Mycena kentingensis (nom. inval.)]|nr:hypothetical protein MKEN_01125800 [Mycena kentingensis (nom. inval.)]